VGRSAAAGNIAAAMTSGEFTRAASAQAAGLTIEQLRYYAARHVVAPSARPAAGRGSSVRYTFFDLLKLRVIRLLHNDTATNIEMARSAARELDKVRAGGWTGAYLTTSDWDVFWIRDRNALAALADESLCVTVSLAAVDRDLRVALRLLGMSAGEDPGRVIRAALAG